MKLRSCRRFLGGVIAGVVALSAMDQGGGLEVTAGRVDFPGEARGAALTIAGEFASLQPRLRMAAVPAPLDSAAGVALELAPPVGDVPIAPPPLVFEQPATPRPQPPPPEQLRAATTTPGVTRAGGTWAVLVGINDYPGQNHDLRSAVNDANDVDEALKKMGVPGDRRLILRDGQATADRIRSAIDWLVTRASPDAKVVFFYAGHVQKVASSTEAMVGSDGGLIHDQELADRLEGLQAKHAWIGIAACYSGGFTEVVKAGRILTAAATADSLAYENDGFGRSYLVEYMIRRGMIGRGFTTVEGAFAWADSELKRDYPNRTALQHDQVNGDLDLRPVPTRNPPSPSGSQQPPPSSGGGGGSPPPPPPPDDGCSGLTAGFVRCS